MASNNLESSAGQEATAAQTHSDALHQDAYNPAPAIISSVASGAVLGYGFKAFRQHLQNEGLTDPGVVYKRSGIFHKVHSWDSGPVRIGDRVVQIPDADRPALTLEKSGGDPLYRFGSKTSGYSELQIGRKALTVEDPSGLNMTLITKGRRAAGRIEVDGHTFLPNGKIKGDPDSLPKIGDDTATYQDLLERFSRTATGVQSSARDLFSMPAGPTRMEAPDLVKPLFDLDLEKILQPLLKAAEIVH